MAIDSTVSPPLTRLDGGLDAPGLEQTIVKRSDGVYADPTGPAGQLLAAFDRILAGNSYFSDLDYPTLIKALYDVGPAFGRAAPGDLRVRLAGDIVPFDPARRGLYKAFKINHGQAEYYFEPVRLADPDDPYGAGELTRLDLDEFIADMWLKGIRFGIDVEAVRAAIASGKSERVVVAVRLEPVPGRDAQIIEVSEDIHRSDAPRQLANGKLDLMAFQNRFPQIHKGAKLLKKIPRAVGVPGVELSGMPIEPAVPSDIELGPMAGPGTLIENTEHGEFLVAQQAGFLNVDSKTSQISIGDKIVSRDGVSARTTGNLQLTGDYEEFGEVQEKRVIEGEGITIHADVFGNIVSRGGAILLHKNLVGGSAHNACGAITINGVASGAVVQSSDGEVVIKRAESCVISGTRVRVEHAVNCEIMADEIVVGHAEGCALAARKVSVDNAAPRKQSEMLVFALCPDTSQVDEVIKLMSARVDEFEALAQQRRVELDNLTAEPEVRNYVMLAARVRKKEITLNAEQAPQFQKMAQALGPALKAIARVSLEMKGAETERQAGLELVAQLVQQRSDSEGVSQVSVHAVQGDTLVRIMPFNPDGTRTYDLQAKDIKANLRGAKAAGKIVFAGSEGSFDWTSGAA